VVRVLAAVRPAVYRVLRFYYPRFYCSARHCGRDGAHPSLCLLFLGRDHLRVVRVGLVHCPRISAREQLATADETELVPPSVCCFLGRDHLRVVRVGVVRSLDVALGPSISWCLRLRGPASCWCVALAPRHCGRESTRTPRSMADIN